MTAGLAPFRKHIAYVVAAYGVTELGWIGA